MSKKYHETVIDRIQNVYGELYKAEQKVAQFILDNISDVANMNVSEIAEKSRTSEATVVRTSKHLGYDGYYQMRLLISKDIGMMETESINDDSLSSSQKFFNFEAERIKSLVDMIDFAQIIKTANIILNATKVHVVAVGNTTTISSDLCFRLQRLGINSTYSPMAEYFYNNISLGESTDVVIAISRSGSSTQIIHAVEQACKKQMKTIVVTGERNRQLIDNADVVFEVNSKFEEPRTLSTPDSHLLEYAINDAILYATKNVAKITKGGNIRNSEDRDNIGILLSEFKL